MKKNIPPFLLEPEKPEILMQNAGKSRLPFIDKTLRTVGNTVKIMYIHSETGQHDKPLFKINPLIKVFSLVFLIVVLSFANKIYSQLTASVLVFGFYLISGVPFNYIYKKILFLSLIFGLLIFLPASLNVITPGNIIFTLFSFDHTYHFWIYHVPQTIGVTDAGVRIVALLFLRVFNSISLAMIFVYSSSFTQLVKGLKVFFIPDTFLMILSLAYKFIFILSKTITETYFALKSKLFGPVRNNKIRKIISGRVFFVFKKSKSNYENTFYAMVSRGYTGKIILYREKHIKLYDLMFLATVIGAGFLILFI